MKGKLTWKPAGLRAKRWRNAAQLRGYAPSSPSARSGVKVPAGLPPGRQVLMRERKGA